MNRTKIILLTITLTACAAEIQLKRTKQIEVKINLKPSNKKQMKTNEELLEVNKDNTQLIKLHEIGEPFTVIEIENKYFLCLGKYRLSEAQETLKDAKELTKPNVKNWNTILGAVNAMIMHHEELKETNLKINNNE